MTRFLSRLALEIWLPVAVVASWWFLSASSTSPYWPPLQTIVETFERVWLFDRFATDFLPSVGRFAAGFLIALVVGILLGLILGILPKVRKMFDPIIDFMRALPGAAVLPIAIALLGVGDEMKVFIIFLGAVWPILLNMIDGVRSTDPTMLDMGRAFRLSKMQSIRYITIPSAMPQLFVGIRLSLSIALILMVVSEMFASTNGLGYYILISQQTFAIPEMWSGILLLGILGYAVNVLGMVLEKPVLAWHRGSRGNSMEGSSTP